MKRVPTRCRFCENILRRDGGAWSSAEHGERCPNEGEGRHDPENATPMNVHRFYVPAMVILDVKAPTAAAARRAAADWQYHANKWEQLAELDDVAEFIDPDDDWQGALIDGHALCVIDTKRGPLLAVIETPEGDVIRDIPRVRRPRRAKVQP